MHLQRIFSVLHLGFVAGIFSTLMLFSNVIFDCQLRCRKTSLELQSLCEVGHLARFMTPPSPRAAALRSIHTSEIQSQTSINVATPLLVIEV